MKKKDKNKNFTNGFKVKQQSHKKEMIILIFTKIKANNLL